MEKRKAENQSAIKKDKLLERSFKREFSADPRFDTLSKLYKKRLLEENSQSTYPLDPFVETSSNLENRSIPLSDNEIPEGLPEEVWVKFLEYRESKMTAELELFKTNQRLREIETILQDVNTALDAIKDETAKLTDTMNRLVQHKFNNAFNIEQLYEFKQGHIEVSQAPLVTNYSDAILIHKSAIETLNDEVIALGQLKVDALTEIKDYRKGIHALEWENKMHDFQAEDMIIKAREVQLLRLSKEMQEYLRNGNVQRQSSEVNNLERMLEHSQKSHLSGLNDREDTIAKLQSSRKKTMQENSRLQKQIEGLRMAVEEKSKIQDIKSNIIF